MALSKRAAVLTGDVRGWGLRDRFQIDAQGFTAIGLEVISFEA
jgi:hypothetical protein